MESSRRLLFPQKAEIFTMKNVEISIVCFSLKITDDLKKKGNIFWCITSGRSLKAVGRNTVPEVLLLEDEEF